MPYTPTELISNAQLASNELDRRSKHSLDEDDYDSDEDASSYDGSSFDGSDDSGSYYSDGSGSDWDSDMEELAEAMQDMPAITQLKGKIHSSPAIVAMTNLAIQNQQQHNSKLIANRMRNSESEVFAKTVSKDMVVLAPSTKPANDVNSEGAVNPEIQLAEMLKRFGFARDDLIPTDRYFLKVRQANINAYTIEIARAVRNLDMDTIKKVKESGGLLQCCNRFGESIVHTVCRRGSVEMLDFLTSEADVTIRVRDDYGRTPLHDAGWTDKPNFELVKRLLEDSPQLLFVADNRGHTPLSYVPNQRWGDWNNFLAENETFIRDVLVLSL